MRNAPLALALIALALARPAAAQIVYDANDIPIDPAAKPKAPVVRPSSTRRLTAQRSTTPIALVTAIPILAPPTPVAVTVRPSINPLKASATALYRRGDQLFLGLRDGGMAFCDARDGKNGTAVRFVPSTPVPPVTPTTAPAAPIIDPVRAITAIDGAIWWVSSDGTQVFAYRESERTAVSYNVAAPAGWVQRLAVLDGSVYLLGDGVARILDPTSGALRIPTEIDLPPSALAADGRATLYLAPCDHDDDAVPALLAMVTGDGSAPRLWHSSLPHHRRHESPTREWREVLPTATGGTFDSGALGENTDLPKPTLASLRHAPRHSSSPIRAFTLATDGCAVALADGLHLVQPDMADDASQAADIPFGHTPGMPTSLERCTVGASGVWWQMRGVLFHGSSDGRETSAFLPWNSAKGAQIQTLLADTDGVYVALDKGGVRHVTPGSPTPTDGYAGYVLARLGDTTTTPSSTEETSIAAEIEDWQGVPYKWGGQTKAGTDCSGFVGAMHKAVGIDIPRSTSEMTASKQGTRILDEIRYGDVLVYPGHCALYIGNGVTAETVAAAVGKASIWRRTDVQVRRYLP